MEKCSAPGLINHNSTLHLPTEKDRNTILQNITQYINAAFHCDCQVVLPGRAKGTISRPSTGSFISVDSKDR